MENPNMTKRSPRFSSSIPITISLRKVARYRTECGPSQKRMTVFLICCES